MRIATFNINGVNKRLEALLMWLDHERPAVVCLQELKAGQTQFPEAAIQELGYRATWVGEQSWNGVAILSRLGEPVVTRRSLPGDPADPQSRYLEAAVNGWVIGCLYAPNGNPWPGPKFEYKLAWLRRLIAHAATLQAVAAPVVLAGDYNVVPTDADIYSLRSWKKNALVQPEPRALFAELLSSGWTDALVAGGSGALDEGGSGAPPRWTFWSYLREAWPRNAGLRIDHLLLNVEAAARLTGAGVDDWVRGLEDASDHAPAWIEIR
jgi:exodeoxyribonuclease III